MSRLERIKARGKAAEVRSGRQYWSWERERELRDWERETRRMILAEDYAIGMGGPEWWKD